MESVVPDYIDALVDRNVAAILWSLTEAKRQGSALTEIVLLVIDLTEVGTREKRLVATANAVCLGGVAVACVDIGIVRSSVKAMGPSYAAMLVRLSEAPPAFFVHALIFSSGLPSPALTFAPAYAGALAS